MTAQSIFEILFPLFQCEWAENFGIHVMYIVCNEKNHYVGGTKAGREFLSTNPHLPASFLISTKPDNLIATIIVIQIL